MSSTLAVPAPPVNRTNARSAGPAVNVLSGAELEDWRLRLEPQLTDEVRALLGEKSQSALRPVNQNVSEGYSRYCFAVYRNAERLIKIGEIRAKLAAAVDEIGLDFIKTEMYGYYLQLLTEEVPDNATPRRLELTERAIIAARAKAPARLMYSSISTAPVVAPAASAVPAPRRRVDNNGWGRKHFMDPEAAAQSERDLAAKEAKIVVGAPNAQSKAPSKRGEAVAGKKKPKK